VACSTKAFISAVRKVLEIERLCDGLVSRGGGGHELRVSGLRRSVRSTKMPAAKESCGHEVTLDVAEEPRCGCVEVVRVFGA
jgi:hypothetical protein